MNYHSHAALVLWTWYSAFFYRFMAIVPLLKGSAAKSIVNDFKASHLKNFSEQERQKTNSVIEEKTEK